MLIAGYRGAIAAVGAGNAEPQGPLPEDLPLPPAGTILSANTANFNSVYASAAAGSHIVMANGNYGARTLNRSFPSGNRLVIRAQNLLGAAQLGGGMSTIVMNFPAPAVTISWTSRGQTLRLPPKALS
jgi:hypothetical protein